jgi:predicted TIM-barrel fold metal-dependent hydrolase
MGYDRTWMSLVDARLVEFDERLAAMDAAGVDVSVLSHTVPGAQGIADPSLAAAAARDINDVLAGAIARHPARFAGLASVALHDPAVGARELERAVTTLGFKGAMINGYTNVDDPRGGEYLDAPRLLPFWEAVAHLGVPVYLHPRPALDQRVHDGHAQLIGATWGFAPETASHALRLVHSGLFDRFPSVTVVLGHLGETLPYFAWRIQHCFEFNPTDKRLDRPPAGLPLRQLLRVHERLLQRPGAHRRGADDRGRPHPVCGGLSLRADGAGHGVDRTRADQRDRSPQDRALERPGAVQAAVPLSRRAACGGPDLRLQAHPGQ